MSKSDKSKGKRASGKTTRDIVLKQFRDNPGRIYSLDELALIAGAPETTIQSTMRDFAKTIPEVQTIVKGRMWRSNDMAKAEDQTPAHPLPRQPMRQGSVLRGSEEGEPFLRVGTDRIGNPILRDPKGVLYRAEEI